MTRFITYPGGAKVCEGLAACGNLDSLWGRIAPEIEACAREIGCTDMHAMGRFGWGRAAQKHGWKPEMVIITKRIAHD